MMKFVILLVVCTTYVCGQTANYCAAKLCGSRKHIACKNTGSFASTCTKDRAIVPIGSYKTIIVQKHNEYRNKIASGNLPGFKSASRMATMKWDDELARLAEMNVKQCVMKHDACRNTDRFKYSGQNLAWRWGRPAPSARDTIVKGIDSWFNEYKDAKMAYIDKYHSAPKVIGHFTGMVGDKNTHVGCAILQQSKNGGVEYIFGCNYSNTNILNHPIYVSGTVASKCIKGRNPTYKGLCAASEPIDPNKL